MYIFTCIHERYHNTSSNWGLPMNNRTTRVSRLDYGFCVVVYIPFSTNTHSTQSTCVHACTKHLYTCVCTWTCTRVLLTFLLQAHSLSHSMTTMAREEPWVTMNCLRPSTVIPWRRTPRTVGKRGSSLCGCGYRQASACTHAQLCTCTWLYKDLKWPCVSQQRVYMYLYHYC